MALDRHVATVSKSTAGNCSTDPSEGDVTYRVLVDFGTAANAQTFQVDGLLEGENEVCTTLAEVQGARYGVILDARGSLRRRYVVNARGEVERVQ